VILASSVAEALVQIADFRPDILLSDVGMPDEDDDKLIRRVRADHSDQDIPAVALTAFARTEDRERAIQAGFKVHITKPVDPDELTAAIASLTDRTNLAS